LEDPKDVDAREVATMVSLGGGKKTLEVNNKRVAMGGNCWSFGVWANTLTLLTMASVCGYLSHHFFFFFFVRFMPPFNISMSFNFVILYDVFDILGSKESCIF
jgi:hypothetical protein